jgi:hypothetical protein
MYTKSTLRKMAKTPDARKFAEAINDIERGLRKLKRQLPVIQELEFQSQALKRSQFPQDTEAAPASEDIGIRPDKSKQIQLKSSITPLGWGEEAKQ